MDERGYERCMLGGLALATARREFWEACSQVMLMNR